MKIVGVGLPDDLLELVRKEGQEHRNDSGESYPVALSTVIRQIVKDYYRKKIDHEPPMEECGS
jgi:hypothetical protein